MLIQNLMPRPVEIALLDRFVRLLVLHREFDETVHVHARQRHPRSPGGSEGAPHRRCLGGITHTQAGYAALTPSTVIGPSGPTTSQRASPKPTPTNSSITPIW